MSALSGMCLQSLRRRFPRGKDRCLFGVFVIVALVCFVLAFVGISQRLAQSHSRPITIERVAELSRNELNPSFFICGIVPPGAWFNLGVIDSASSASEQSEFIIDPGVYEASSLSKEDLNRQLVRISNLTFDLATFREGPQYRVSIPVGATAATCLLGNLQGRSLLPDDPRLWTLALPYADFTLIMSKEAYSYYETFENFGRFFSIGFFDYTRASSLFGQGYILTRTISPRGVYDVTYDVTITTQLDGTTTKDFVATPVYSGVSIDSTTSDLHTLGIDGGNYTSTKGRVSFRPASTRARVIEFHPSYSFSDWMAALGGLISIVAAVFSLLFPTLLLLPRETRFYCSRILCDCASGCAGGDESPHQSQLYHPMVDGSSSDGPENKYSSLVQ